ncbi:MGMT family protein [Myroides sp. LJL116]
MAERDFFERVFQVVRLIPFGRVTTYGAIANYLGSAKSARVVGYALNSSKGEIDIPAHRVVNKDGLLTGKKYFQGISLMQQLLESESVLVFDNKVVDFKSLFWDPSKEL